MRYIRLEENWEPFSCPVAGRAVYVHRIWKVIHDGAGVEMGRIAVKMTCEYQSHCSIASYGANGIVYDWNKCAFTGASKSKRA